MMRQAFCEQTMKTLEIETRDSHVRVVIDGIDLLTTITSADPDSRTFLANFSTLEISNENVLEFSDGIVVPFDQIR